jgi:hypothetical protein
LKRAFLLLFAFTVQAFGSGLAPHAQLIVSDSVGTPHNGVRVTYLGTNAYQFEFKGHALLVDPYFSRVDLVSVAVGSRIQPDISRIADGIRRLAPKVDAILVTHGTFRSFARCTGCDFQNTRASHCFSVQHQPCETRGRFIWRRSDRWRQLLTWRSPSAQALVHQKRYEDGSHSKNTSCKIHRNASPVLRNFGSNARRRVASARVPRACSLQCGSMLG